MKKKLLSFLTCLSIILIGAFALVGCGDDPADTNIYVTTETQLVTAVNNASNNAKIVLKNDIQLTNQLIVTKTLTLDLNGKEISNTTDIWNETNKTWSLISVQANGKLTITGNGSLNSKEKDCFAVDARDNAEVTIKNGTFNGNLTCLYVINNAIINVEGGSFNIQQLSEFDDYRYLLNVKDENNQDATFVVKGGTFSHYDPAHSNSENPQMNFVAEGYQSVADGDNFVVSKIAD